MKANEIRINNYLNFTCSDPIKQVQVDKGYFLSQGFWRDLHDGCFKPIPLTEEWLLNLGIKKKEFDDYYTLSENYWGIHISKSDNGKFDVHIRNEYMLCEIKHVHQLQNLYFALTGEKLTIKENEPTI